MTAGRSGGRKSAAVVMIHLRLRKDLKCHLIANEIAYSEVERVQSPYRETESWMASALR
jgi:hypothetical protein